MLFPNQFIIKYFPYASFHPKKREAFINGIFIKVCGLLISAVNFLISFAANKLILNRNIGD
jgi:hypothetical protein